LPNNYKLHALQIKALVFSAKNAREINHIKNIMKTQLKTMQDYIYKILNTKFEINTCNKNNDYNIKLDDLVLVCAFIKDAIIARNILFEMKNKLKFIDFRKYLKINLKL